MARFTSVHPLILTEPAARFTPVEGNPDLFECESDDPAVILALQHLGEQFGITEDDGEQAAEPAAAPAAPEPALTPAQVESAPVPPVDDEPQD